MEQPSVIRLYRICWTDPPTETDMMSNQALGKRPRWPDSEALRLWAGISLFDTAERARSQAMRHPWRGRAFIAALDIPAGVFQMERTRSRGHYTLWGEPRDILEYVRRVEPV